MRKLVREDKTIKISRDVQKLSSKIETARSMMHQSLMRNPTNSELASYLGIEEYIIADAINSNYQVKSIDEPLKQDSKEITLNDIIPDNIKDINTLITLKDELKKLSYIETELIKNRYILDYTQQKTADILGMSQVKVSREEQKVLEKLRKKLV